MVHKVKIDSCVSEKINNSNSGSSESGKEKPLVSLIVLSYNQEKYIREAVEGALAQTYDRLEIVFSDDCSTDASHSIIESVLSAYVGRHKIIVNRNSENLGIARHVNKAFSIASGDIIAVAAGDDISLPQRISQTVQAFEKAPDISYVDLEKVVIDERGYLKENAHLNAAGGEEIFIDINHYVNGVGPLKFNGAGRALSRSVITSFGPLLDETPTEDTTYFLRCLLKGRGLYLNKPGILYRQHSRSLSSTEGLRKISIEKIFAQYAADVEHALKRGMVDDNTYSWIKRWLLKAEAIRRMEYDLLYGRDAIKCLVIRVLLAENLPLNVKLKYLYRILKKSFL